MRRQLNLILHIARRGGRNAVIIRIRGALPESDGTVISGIRQRNIDGVTDLLTYAGKITGIAKIIGFLAAKVALVNACEQYRSPVKNQIRLVEEIFGPGRVVVGRDRYLVACGIDRARKYVLIELVIDSIAGAVAKLSTAAEVVIQRGIEGIDRYPAWTARRVAEKCGGVGLDRPAPVPGNTPIGGSVILVMFVTQCELPV